MATHLAAAGKLVIPAERIWTPGPPDVLDQGDKPECVAFATTVWELGGPNPEPLLKIDTPDVLYAKCQLLDGIPGEHEGTTVRAAMDVMRSEKRLGRYVWAETEAELWQWVMTQGPAILGITWFECMMTPDANGVVHVNLRSPMAGGHGIYCYGGLTAKKWYYIQNSWGSDWAIGGRFRVSRADMVKLLKLQGEACGALEVCV
jgi:hypothetical protein